jgi:hypothetical protein
MLPMVAATPPQHHQDALFICEAKEILRLELALQPDGVEIHVANHADLVAQATFICAQQHVLRPAGAANQNRLPVHAKQTASVCRQL